MIHLDTRGSTGSVVPSQDVGNGMDRSTNPDRFRIHSIHRTLSKPIPSGFDTQKPWEWYRCIGDHGSDGTVQKHNPKTKTSCERKTMRKMRLTFERQFFLLITNRDGSLQQESRWNGSAWMTSVRSNLSFRRFDRSCSSITRGRVRCLLRKDTSTLPSMNFSTTVWKDRYRREVQVRLIQRLYLLGWDSNAVSKKGKCTEAKDPTKHHEFHGTTTHVESSGGHESIRISREILKRPAKGAFFHCKVYPGLWLFHHVEQLCCAWSIPWLRAKQNQAYMQFFYSWEALISPKVKPQERQYKDWIFDGLSHERLQPPYVMWFDKHWTRSGHPHNMISRGNHMLQDRLLADDIPLQMFAAAQEHWSVFSTGT